MKTILLTIFFIFISILSFAQTDSHTEAVNELTELMKMDERMEEMVDRVVALQIQSNPVMAQYEKIFSDFFHKYMNWENLKGDFTELYKEYYTEKEIREISEFYKTDTGQKVARLMPQLFAKGGEIGQNIAMEHQNELLLKLGKAMQDSNAVYEMDEIKQ